MCAFSCSYNSLSARHSSAISWEIAANPRVREAELLGEFLRLHGRLPRGNGRGA